MTGLHYLFSIVFLLCGVCNSLANDEIKDDLITAISQEVVGISSNFTGAHIVVFGSVERAIREEGDYDVVVVVKGPEEDITVREKARVAGIWTNRHSRTFANLPSSYVMLSNRPLREIGEREVFELFRVGFRNLEMHPTSKEEAGSQELYRFRDALLRIKERQGLYQEVTGGLTFMSHSLFRADVPIPANIPIGTHSVQTFLFRNGLFVTSIAMPLRIEKKGFERYTYSLAHEQSALYGILAIIIAMFTGWAASVIFRK